jgi:GH24 family phage-related lysozyme (muramidase)
MWQIDELTSQLASVVNEANLHHNQGNGTSGGAATANGAEGGSVGKAYADLEAELEEAKAAAAVDVRSHQPSTATLGPGGDGAASMAYWLGAVLMTWPADDVAC